MGRVDSDGSRFLLSDYLGGLFVLVLQHDAAAITGLALEYLGETSIASTLSYLDGGVVFVGSASADSQLLRLNAAKDPGSGLRDQPGAHRGHVRGGPEGAGRRAGGDVIRHQH